MSKVPAGDERADNAENLSELATRMTSEITKVRTRVHEDRTTTILLRDMDAEQLEEIGNSLATVIAAAYLPIAKSNGHMTRCTAIGLKKRLDSYKLSTNWWERDGGKNDSAIEEWMTWRLRQKKFHAHHENFMKARLAFPASTETATDGLPDGYKFKVTKRSQTLAAGKSLVSHVPATSIDQAKDLENGPPSPPRSSRKPVTIDQATKQPAPLFTAPATVREATTATDSMKLRDRFNENRRRLSLRLNKRSKPGNSSVQTNASAKSHTAAKASFWNSTRRSWMDQTNGSGG